MKRLLGSIKGRIFLSLLGLTSLLLIAVGLFLYHEVREIVFAAIDRTLHSKVQVITGLLHEEHGAIELELSEVILGEYSIPRSGHYYKVLMDGKPLASSPSLVDSGFDLASGIVESGNERLHEKIYTSVGPDGEPVRVLRQDLKAFGRSFVVFAAESLSESIEMIDAFRNFLFLVIGAGVLIVCLTGFWIAKRSLDPLKVFSENIRTITHRTLARRIGADEETQELTVLADSFNSLLVRLQKAFESEKRLIADASNELKTPISVIKARCDVTLQRERQEKEYVEALKTVRAVSEDMDTVVRDLLSLARLDSGVLSPEDFTALSLTDCINKAAEMLQPLAKKKQIHVITNIDRDIAVEGDRDRLTEAFLNIIENGVKYSNENGYVEVSAREEAGKAVVLVKDSGTGIRQEDMARIYDRFYRADSSRGAEGTGLGLSITRRLTQQLGGQVTVSSEFGEGTTFSVRLPLSIRP